MSKRTKLWLIIAIPLLILAAGCAPECTHQELDSHYINNPHPIDGFISSSLAPTFDWTWGPQCNPHQFRIETYKDTHDQDVTYQVNGSERDFTVSPPLEPGGKYFWRIYTIASDDYLGRSTQGRILYTGPFCPSSPPVTPVLESPEEGAFITPRKPNSEVEFHWYYPDDCLPTSFLYEFATDLNFQNIIASGETQDHSQFVALNLPDCIKVYWHVAAKNGNQVGPFSATHSFSWIADPTCWMNHYPSDEVGLIRGRVYLDFCPQTKSVLPVNQNLAEGCIQTSGFGITADGDIDYNEGAEFKPHPGLKNVVVDLGQGPCPSTDLAQDVTGSKGRFAFTVLTPGEYCLSVSKSQTGHQVEAGLDFNMLGGLWTQPLTHSERAEYTNTFGEGWADVKYDFGWDEYDAFIRPILIEKIWCRRIPFHWCDPLHLFEVGDMAPMLARNEAGTWIKTSIQGEICYFYNSPEEQEMVPYSLGIPEDEYIERFNQLEVFEAPPPCPTPTPPPRQKPDSDPCAGKSDRDCIADPNCKWVPTAAGPGYCAPK